MEEVDFNVYYYDARRPVWVLLGSAVMLATTFRPIAFDRPLLVPDNRTSLANLFAVPVLWKTKNRTDHAVAVSLAMVLVLGDIVVWSGEMDQ